MILSVLVRLVLVKIVVIVVLLLWFIIMVLWQLIIFYAFYDYYIISMWNGHVLNPSDTKNHTSPFFSNGYLSASNSISFGNFNSYLDGLN